jgi:hypothetical protein
MPHSNKNSNKPTLYEDSRLETNTLDYPHSNRERYFTNQDLETAEDKELLTITVEIGDGQHENIVILNDESAEEVAERF